MYTVYTWSSNDLYFLKVNPPKKGLFQPKQGSFGFRVYKYVYYLPIDAIFLCTWYTLSSAHPGTLPWTLPSFWLQLHPHVLNTLLQDFGPGYLSADLLSISNLRIIYMSSSSSAFPRSQSGNGKANPGLVRRSICNQKTAITLIFKVSSTEQAYTNHHQLNRHSD